MTKCKRCGADPHPTRMFCPGCGLIQPGRAGMRISTTETRGRALDEIDRLCGTFDTDAEAERKMLEAM